MYDLDSIVKFQGYESLVVLIYAAFIGYDSIPVMVR